MSGILGIAAFSQVDTISVSNDMVAAMSHRNWYDSDLFTDDTYNLTVGRIGIGVFNRAKQPVWNPTRSVALVMAGEISEVEAIDNHDSIQSDAQKVLALYEDCGDSFINYLKGAFIIALWDKRRNHLLIANDRYGLYPLYYAHFKGRLIFAPEMKGVLCDSELGKKLNLTALAEYMRFQHLLGDKTFFENIKLLPNASLLRYDISADHLAIKSYWNLSRIPALPKNLTFNDAVEEAGRLLEKSVNRLTEGDHSFGVYLSGGLDSRVILGLIDHDKFPITTVTFGQQGCRDVEYARRIADQVGTNHHYFEFSDGKWVKQFAAFHLELTEGFHSWIHSHGISILDQVRPLLDVNLTGLGGWPSGIYWEDPVLLQASDDASFSCRLFRLLCEETTWPSITEAEERNLYSSKLDSQIRDLAFSSFESELAKFDFLSFEQRAAYFAICNPDRRLFQYYTVFHGSHFEQRFPFYDYDYFDFVYALPPEMLFDRKLRKAIILKKMRPLAKIPYDKDNLPITDSKASFLFAKLIQKSKSLVNRHLVSLFPEHATLYADYENWLRNELHDWGKSILLGEKTLQRDIFNAEFLRSLWRRHQSGLEIHTIGKIAPIMTYEMMLRRFYD